MSYDKDDAIEGLTSHLQDALDLAVVLDSFTDEYGDGEKESPLDELCNTLVQEHELAKVPDLEAIKRAFDEKMSAAIEEFTSALRKVL